VFVDYAAEDTLSPYGRVDRHDHARVVVGRPLIPALMWTMPVEMPFVGGEDGAGVSLVVDQDVVETLPPYAAHDPEGCLKGATSWIEACLELAVIGCRAVGDSGQLHPAFRHARNSCLA
jgi:hypothetical protein